jgi:hypothetical protein
MTAADMTHLAGLYRQIETLLEKGESSSPELVRLFAEVAKLQSGEDVWFNLDPKGISDVARLGAEFGPARDGSPGSASGWR